MRKYLLPEDGMFYKANMHCHSTLSDGEFSPMTATMSVAAISTSSTAEIFD